ncbi:MAG: glucan biosynthesis protein G [Thalassovita sp.]
MIRREILAGLLGLAASPVLGQAKAGEPAAPDEPNLLKLGEPTAFDPEMVVQEARNRAAKPFQMRRAVNQAWSDISYEDYQNIWFDTRNALWTDDPEAELRLDVFAPGLYFPHPIQLEIVEDGQTRPLLFDLETFDRTDQFPDLPIDDSLGYSGFRLRGQIEKPGIYQEFSVFQGASYFRAIGTGDIYGLSARGLAIDTAEPTGEEFPDFVAYWLERPEPGATSYVVHALLDSPSCSGAYRFVLTPGQPLKMDVSATVFPREEIKNIGLAPLTSMFYFDETNRDRFSDFRPSVHDSDGLLINNGAGETIWRPLANPRHLQISAFIDENPKGFGLMQRPRNLGNFADLHAHYHRRPGLWVEPHEGWGKGAVTLVEIPTDREIYDNIVAYWRPETPWQAGEEHHLTYGLTWGPQSNYGAGLRVLNTRIGAAHHSGLIIAIDFEDGDTLPDDLGEIEQIINASGGSVKEGVIQRNPETGGIRLAFHFEPEDAGLVEFRVLLRLNEQALTETWLYRWTA